jgi:hypothetical protein
LSPPPPPPRRENGSDGRLDTAAASTARGGESEGRTASVAVDAKKAAATGSHRRAEAGAADRRQWEPEERSRRAEKWTC